MHAYTQAHCHGKHWSSYLGISFTVLIIKNRGDGTFEVFIVWHFRCFAQMDSKPVILSQLGILFSTGTHKKLRLEDFQQFSLSKFFMSCHDSQVVIWDQSDKRHFFSTMWSPNERSNLNETLLLWQLFDRHLESRVGIRKGYLCAVQSSHSLFHIYSKRRSVYCLNQKPKNTNWVCLGQLTYLLGSGWGPCLVVCEILLAIFNCTVLLLSSFYHPHKSIA